MSTKHPKKYDADIPPGSPSQAGDNEKRWPDDDLIRSAGFQIFARPRHGPPVWLLRGKHYTHSEALALAPRITQERPQLAPSLPESDQEAEQATTE